MLCSLDADRQTDTKVNTEDTLSGFQDFSNFPSTYHQGAVQYNNIAAGWPFLSLSDKWVIFCRFFVVVRRVFLHLSLCRFLSLLRKFCRFLVKNGYFVAFFIFINDGFHIFTLLALLSCLYITFCVKF